MIVMPKSLCHFKFLGSKIAVPTYWQMVLSKKQTIVVIT